MNKFTLRAITARKFVLTSLVLLFMLTNILVVYNIYKLGRLAPSDVGAASDGEYHLRLISPSTLNGAANNSTFKVGIYAKNTQDASVGEIVLTYNPAVVEGVNGGITEDSTFLLALNKSVNNSTGRITVDIAKQGDGFFPSDTTLVTFDFIIKNNSATNAAITVATGSTLGYPNKLSSTGYGSYPLAFTTNAPVVTCGDGVTGGTEQCDDGSQNGVACSPAYGSSCTYCSTSCNTVTVQGAKCGDGYKQGSEQCDDGNTNSGDGCSSSCKTEQVATNPPPANNPPPTTTTPPTNPPPANNPPPTTTTPPTNVGTDTGSGSDTDTGSGTTTPPSNVDNDTDTDEGFFGPVIINEPTNSGGSTITDTNKNETQQNRTTLIGVLVFTVTGTLVSLFLLIKAILAKPVNENPFTSTNTNTGANPF